jgi:hypothetical protein
MIDVLLHEPEKCCMSETVDIEYYLRPKKKECNYVLRASKNSSCLIKFLANTIYIYDSKIIYYKNIFRN